MEAPDYSPQATHELYISASEIPRPSSDELLHRLKAFETLGYHAIAGVVVGSWETSVSQAIALHEKGRLYVRQGLLVGPYTMSYGVLLPGVKFYRQD